MSKCKCGEKICAMKVSSEPTPKNVLVTECKHCGKQVVSWTFDNTLEKQK